MSDLVYTLERNTWRWYGPKLNRLTRLPGRVRLRTFADADEAERERLSLEAEVRGGVNPFRCGVGLGALTTFDAGRLRDWLLDAELEPPASMAVKDLEAWWEAASLSGLQRARVWEGLDRLRFHEVIRQPKRPVVYVAVQVNWNYNDEGYTAGSEGGRSFQAFRTRERAQAFCDDNTDVGRDMWEEILEEADESLDDQLRRIAATGPAGTPPPTPTPDVPVRDATFWEVHEVELEG